MGIEKDIADMQAEILALENEVSSLWAGIRELKSKAENSEVFIWKGMAKIEREKLSSAEQESISFAIQRAKHLENALRRIVKISKDYELIAEKNPNNSYVIGLNRGLQSAAEIAKNAGIE